MPVRKTVSVKSGASDIVRGAAAPARPSAEDAVREKVEALFDPTYVRYLNGLGCDLSRLRVNDLYDLIQGKLTRPLDLVVTPLAYDRDLRRNVEMPRIKVVAGLQVVWPRKNGRLAPLDDSNRAFLNTVPCLPYLERAEGHEAVTGQDPGPAPSVESAPVSFTEAQLMALEGVGVSRDRLYGGPGAVSREDKAAMAAGERFPVNGAVNTSGGLIRVIGEAMLVTGADGAVEARFQSTYPEERGQDTVIDLLSARRQEILTREGRTVVEFDFFQRDSGGRVISDVNGRPLLNKAGENVVRYGMAMEPVMGYVHNRSYDQKERKWADNVERRHFQVSVENGNLCFSQMREVPDLAPDGSEVKVRDRSGAEVVKTHPEVAVSRVADGKVFLDGGAGKPLEFVSREDEENFVRGRVAFVKDCVYHDFKSKKDVTYEAAVVSDNRKAGFAKVFTPSTTEAIRESRSAGRAARRKQNFGVGL